MLRFFFLAPLVAIGTFSAFGSVDPGLLALVPPGAQIVSGIDLERARSSQFGQFMTGKMKFDDQDFEKFVNQTGFDPRRDVQQFLFACPGPDAKGDASRFAILARGTFDPDRIKASAKTKGLAPETFHEVSVWVDKSQSKGPNAFAFLGDGVAVMGDLETVRKVISNRGTGGALEPALQAEVSKVAAENDAWFVSHVSGDYVANHLGNAQSSDAQPNADAKQPIPQTQALQSIVQASGGIHFGDMVQVSLDAVTRSAKDATSLADVVRFFTSVVQMQRQKDPRAEIAASAIDNMKLTTDGDTIHLAISLSEKSLEQLVESSPAGSADHHSHAQ